MGIPVRNKPSTLQEQLQPSLLDRLIDDDPGKRRESHDKRVISMSRLRKSVLRDLAWLLNTTHLASSEELDDYPSVAHSVLNYGVSELAGQLVSSLDAGQMEQALRQAIIDFEPRILPQSLRVRRLVEPSPRRVTTAWCSRSRAAVGGSRTLPSAAAHRDRPG